MEIHHGEHHQAYVDNLNHAAKDGPHDGQSVEALIGGLDRLPDTIRDAVLHYQNRRLTTSRPSTTW